MDAEVKVNDAFLSEIKTAKKLRASGLSSLFRRKTMEEAESNLDSEIDAIIKKQEKRRND